MIELINNWYVTVCTSRERQLVEVVWKEHCESDAFRSILSDVMGFVREQGITKWLCDMRRLQYILLADQNWLAGMLLPSMPSQEQEKYRFAYIISLTNLELMSSLAIQATVQGDPLLTGRLALEIFMSRESVLMWLNQLPPYCSK